MKQTIYAITILSAVLISFSAHGLAQSPDTTSTGVRYARFTSVSGDVKLYAVNDVEPRQADLNFPFLEGDRLITGSDGSAELTLDNGCTLWVWSDTKIDMDRLAFQDDGRSQFTRFRLWVGEAVCRFKDPANPASVQIIEFGDSRLTASSATMAYLAIVPDQAVRIRVMSGEIQLGEGPDTRRLATGSMLQRSAGDSNWQESEVTFDDVFREWVIERDKWLSGAYQTDSGVPEDIRERTAGMERDGRWVYNSYLSQWCWTPFVAPDWAPYRFGYWDYIPGWGWTWIPSEPWGWVAYHYGYWAYYYEFGWMWVPHWHWGPHWAAWRYSGRSVHWVPIHPEDRLDSKGRILEGVEPRNSRLQIGMPVESTAEIDMLNQSIRGSTLPESRTESPVRWQNTPPQEMNPTRRMPMNQTIRPNPSQSNRIDPNGWRTLAPPSHRNLVPNRSPEPVRPGQPAPPLSRPTPSKLIRPGADPESIMKSSTVAALFQTAAKSSRKALRVKPFNLLK